ncbi:MAG: ribonuclease P protein component [Patescibacteria group bacterium]|nr:ribonuclease P protein component [Patescibacteria group bacterium]
MLPQKYRLSKTEFKKVLQTGKSIHNDYFVLLYRSDTILSTPKVGFVVSLKVGKKATQRNRAKRLLREAARSKLPKLKQNIQIVLIAKKKLLELDIKQIQVSLNQAFDRTQILKPAED